MKEFLFYFRFPHNVDISIFCAENNTEQMRMERILCINETIAVLCRHWIFYSSLRVHDHAHHLYACESCMSSTSI